MTWPADRSACYGLCCPKHGTCTRYEAVDGNKNEHQVFIDSCAQGNEYPLYQPRKVMLMELEAGARDGTL